MPYHTKESCERAGGVWNPRTTFILTRKAYTTKKGVRVKSVRGKRVVRKPFCRLG